MIIRTVTLATAVTLLAAGSIATVRAADPNPPEFVGMKAAGC
jgi:hypothetical protein